jgi:hypothetical protein
MIRRSFDESVSPRKMRRAADAAQKYSQIDSRIVRQANGTLKTYISMAAVELVNVKKTYGDQVAVDDLSAGGCPEGSVVRHHRPKRQRQDRRR